jgi:hypothetical protein
LQSIYIKVLKAESKEIQTKRLHHIFYHVGALYANTFVKNTVLVFNLAVDLSQPIP